MLWSGSERVLTPKQLFGAMMRASQSYDPYIREAILRIRGMLLLVFGASFSSASPPLINDSRLRPAAGQHRVIALTNNFAKVEVPANELEFLGWKEGVIPGHLRDLFDDFCDSSALGMRSGLG